MKKTFTCIICPRGCTLEADISGGNVVINGNFCPKGKEYGTSECLHPTRTVTAVVKVANRYMRAVSVKTKEPVPKENVFELMDILRKKEVYAPIAIGDVICENIYGTQVIATGSVE